MTGRSFWFDVWRVSPVEPAGGILVSPVSAWEIGLIAAKGQLTFLLHPNAWFRSFLSNSGVRLTPLTPDRHSIEFSAAAA
jgi:PIN domain nuclease of toxin-antitoxin system